MTTIRHTRIDGVPLGISLALLLACAVNLLALTRWL
jgi:hypothetical protein